MNIDQMHIEVKLGVDKLDTASYSDLLPEKIDWSLNKAQERFIKTRYSKNNTYTKGFQEIQKRTDDLNTLVKNVEILPLTVSTNPKIYKIELQGILPDNNTYMFYLRGNVQVSNAKCPPKYVGPILVQIDDLNDALIDPFNKPTINEPIITFEDGGIFVYADASFNVNKFRLTYLRKPIEMSIFDSINCELSETVHREIIDMAVEILIENIESPRIQTAPVFNMTKE